MAKRKKSKVSFPKVIYITPDPYGNPDEFMAYTTLPEAASLEGVVKVGIYKLVSQGTLSTQVTVNV